MSGVIAIENLRNIRRLRFEIPDRGVWLLTAGNGAGKTSLLACLRRIGHANAFQVHFPSSLESDRLDNHVKGKVTYEINGEEVEYAYRGSRWTPRPRGNAHLFEKLGYSSVMYIGATADRITPRPEDFDTKNIRAASSHIVDAANDIFDTKKFSSLRTINLTRGAGNEAFVLSLGGSPQDYHSEKHFSLGELCVLKLTRLIKEARNHSLIIVDELEMALHPRAQVKMLRYLEKQAKAKSLTIIFLTHSVTLLKSIDRKRIVFLNREATGDITPIIGCYPTFAIGHITANEEGLPDAVMYVEDVFARNIVESFYEKFAFERYDVPTTRPSIKIVPIGPFDAVISFLDGSKSFITESVTQKAILDEDVLSESLVSLKNAENHVKLAKYKRVKDDLKYLPFTPEVGLATFIMNDIASFESLLRSRLHDNTIKISSIMAKLDLGVSGAAMCNSSKTVVHDLVSYLSQKSHRSAEHVSEQLCSIFAEASWLQYRAEFMRLFGSILR